MRTMLARDDEPLADAPKRGIQYFFRAVFEVFSLPSPSGESAVDKQGRSFQASPLSAYMELALVALEVESVPSSHQPRRSGGTDTLTSSNVHPLVLRLDLKSPCFIFGDRLNTLSVFDGGEVLIVGIGERWADLMMI